MPLTFRLNEELAPRNGEPWMKSGLRLAEASEKQGGWAEWFKNTRDIDDALKIPLCKLSRDEMIAKNAILLENAKQWYMHMDEAQRAFTVGGFVDYLFPVIRAAFPQNPILNMVSVQVMTKKIGQIFYMHYKYGTNKGASAVKGKRVFDALTGFAGGYHFSDEVVENETLASSSGVSGSNSFTLAFGAGASDDQGGGIRPGTLMLAWTGTDNGMMVARDNGNGVITKDAVSSTSTNTISAATIVYATGGVVVNFGQATASSVLASYEYDSEGSLGVPTVDVEIVSTAVTAQKRALRYRYSAEAAQDMAAEFGMSVDDEVARGVAAVIATEQAREVLADIWSAAGAPYTTFSTTVPGGATPSFTKREYFADLQYSISQTVNSVFQDTQKVHANWAVVDVPFMNVLNAIGAPHFAGWQQAPKDDDGVGIKFVGVWENRVQIWVDPLLQQFSGASSLGNALFGYRGSDFKDAGYVWAPYQMLYTTPSVTLDDFLTRRAMASRVGRKLVNPRMFRRMELTA